MEINNAVYIPDRHQESLTEGPVPGICNFRNFMDEFRQFIPQTTSDTYCIRSEEHTSELQSQR